MTISWQPCDGTAGCPWSGGVLGARDGSASLFQQSGQLIKAMGSPVTFPAAATAPRLMVPLYSGGAHCCTTLYFFWSMPFHTQEVPLLDAGYAMSRDISGNVIIYTNDFSFGYWRTSFAESPAPKFTLMIDPRSGKLVPDFALMLEPVPSAVQIEHESEAWQRKAELWASHLPSAVPGEPVDAGHDWLDQRFSSGLWRVMLDDIYSGNASAALRFFNLAWPDGHTAETKPHFLACFSHQLNRDLLWRQFSLSHELDPQNLFRDQPCS